MKFLHNLPIKRKLMAITMLVSGAALLVACVAFISYEQAAARKQMAQALAITAAVTGANSTAGLSFDEAGSVEQALTSLSAQPDIVQACVYDKAGRPFARYLRQGIGANTPPPSVQQAGHHFDHGRLELFQPITLAGENIGTIYLEEDLSEMTARFRGYALIMVLVLVVSAAVAFFLSAGLQKVISKPLSDLAKTVTIVATEKNYSVRVKRQSSDELGSLIDGFNEMLEQIQERDANLERHVAERTRELAESLSVLNATFGSTADGIVVVNPQRKKIFQNRRAVELWKIPPDIAEGDDDEAQVRFVAQNVTNPAAFLARVEFIYSHPDEKSTHETELKDGTILECLTAPVVGRDGRNYGRIWTFRDVTQSRRDQAALRESEANYFSLVDQMPVGIFRKDREGRYVFVNSWFCRFKGIKPEDYLGKLPRDLTNDAISGPRGRSADAAGLQVAAVEHHAAIIQTGRQIEVDEKYSSADGKVTYFHVVKSPVFGPDGAIVGSQGILLDITQRRQVEEDLTYERELLRSLLDKSEETIYFKDLQSRFIRSSAAQARQFNVENPEVMVGMRDFDFFSEEHARAAFEDEQEIIRTGKPIIGKVEKETWSDGHVTWALTNKMPLRNAKGDIIGTFGISKNITAIKEAEAKLELVHKQLLDASRRAGMAEVATSVLHNVGNVLNSVNVSTTLVLDLIKKSRLNNLGRLAAMIQEQRDNLPAFFTSDPRGKQLPDYLPELARHLIGEQAELVREIELTRKNIEHIKDIVTMQQSYAKVSGVVEKVKVTDLVEDALRMNAGALARHDIHISRDYPAETIEISVERQKVLQILVNLIRNAKYACDESGRPDKWLTMQVRGVSGGGVEIIVSDNGVGIPAENMTRIFSHGFTTRAHGHGFGLHSGALAAKEMSGTLTAHSGGPGAGARFVLMLPLQPSKQL